MSESYASGEFVAKHLTLRGDDRPDEMLESRIQPNGVDVGVWAIDRISGVATFSHDWYSKPNRMKMELRGPQPPRCDEPHWKLQEGSYALIYDVEFEIPEGYVGRMYPRSRVMRSGLHLTSALWDQGYEGVGEGLLQVPQSVFPVFISDSAKLAQFTLIEADSDEAQYDGTHQGERL